MEQKPFPAAGAERGHGVLIAVLCAICSGASTPAQAHQAATPYLPGAPYYYRHLEVARGLDASALRSVDNSPQHNPVNDLGATLGRVLFYDKRLSRNHKVSCASCHQQSRGFADGERSSRGFEGKLTRRNSMGLTNLAFYKSGRFFWDERGKTLEEMVLMPIQDAIEMGMELDELVRRLRQDRGYRHLFRRAFGDEQINADRVGKALAQFLRSMVSFRSRFDSGLVLAGSVEKDFPNFNEEENLGKRVFLGLHDGNSERSCASCHMQRIDTEAFGAAPVLFQSPQALNNGLDSGTPDDDPGVGAVTKDTKDTGKFKAPSLRNIALTAPYMHDGRFATLAEVVEMYSKGLRLHPNLDPRLEPDRPGGWRHGHPRKSRRSRASGVQGTRERTKARALRDTEIRSRLRRRHAGRPFGYQFRETHKRALVAFLNTLTDHELARDPRFSDPFAPPAR